MILGFVILRYEWEGEKKVIFNFNASFDFLCSVCMYYYKHRSSDVYVCAMINIIIVHTLEEQCLSKYLH